MVLCAVTMFQPLLEGKGVEVVTLKVYQPLLVTYHWEGLLTRQIMPLGIKVSTASQAAIRLSNFDSLTFRTELTSTPVNGTIVSIIPRNL